MRIDFRLQVIGRTSAPPPPGDPEVAPVTIPSSVELTGIDLKEVPFTVRNPLGRSVNYNAVKVEIEGPSKDKIKAAVRDNVFSIAAGGEHANVLTVESIEAVGDQDTASVWVLAEEA